MSRWLGIGLSRQHTPAHLTRAVLEGVAFALRDCLDTVAHTGSRPSVVVASGGGTRNPVWRQIITDIIGTPMKVSPYDEHSATGAALLAAHGITGMPLPTATTSGQKCVNVPNPAHRELYDSRFALFGRAYENNRAIMHALADS